MCSKRLMYVMTNFQFQDCNHGKKIIVRITILAIIYYMYVVCVRARGKIQSSLHVEWFHPVVVPMGKDEIDAAGIIIVGTIV